MTPKNIPDGVDITGARENEEYKRQVAAQQRRDQQSLTLGQRIKHFFKNDRTRIGMGVILIVLGVGLLLAFVSFLMGAGMSDQSQVASKTITEMAKNPDAIDNSGKALGATVSNFLISEGVGLAAFIIVIWCIVLAIRLLRRKRAHFFSYTLICLFSLFALSMLLGACTYNFKGTFFPLGGQFGYQANKWLMGLSGIYGMVATNVVIAILWILLCWNTLKKLYQRIPRRGANNKNTTADSQQHFDDDDFPGDNTGGYDSFVDPRARDKATPESQPLKPQPQAARAAAATPRPQTHKPVAQQPNKDPKGAAVMQDIQTANVSNPHDPTGSFRHYKFPPLELLNDVKMDNNRVDITEQEENKKRITETLKNYGITIKDIDVHVGPTVTLFEIRPEDGVRVSKIKGLEDDIAMSLAALGIRIIAPMPGKGTIGIEVPNRDPQIVPMRQVLASSAFQNSKAHLPMCLGCTVTNEVFVADLTKMPHLLVAGATGKGKSVGLNAIITSLLYKKGPSELKFMLVDPKRVEFSVYAGLEQYFFATVPGEDRAIITETEKVVNALNCLVQEMENRYKVLEEIKVRKVEDYNAKWRSELRYLNDEHGDPQYKYMPYIVAIIDEFSDMMMTAGKSVETPIVRIAQKARAVGIHMIIATQRPSAQVITGLIKSNFPGRIAFAVSQMQDSRIIIDRSGAQHLIGRGDMLFSVDGEVTRLQCPFVDTPEVTKICDFIKEQEDNDRDIDHEKPYELPEYIAPTEGGASGGGSGDSGNLKDRDPLFEDAVRYIVSGDTASTSSLQRKYEIGYNRAGRIMDQMEAAGIVGPAQGGKPRKVLMSPMDVDQLFSAPDNSFGGDGLD